MNNLEHASYHLFKKEGLFFVYDINNNAFLNLDPTSYYLMELYRDGYSKPIIETKVKEKYGIENYQRAHREFDLLCSRGYFCRPVEQWTSNQKDKYIKRLLNMATHKIELYLAEACNLRCKYCYVDGNDALGTGLMPWEIAKASVDLALKRSRSKKNLSITFFGGEPLLNKPVLRQIIEYTQNIKRKHGTKVHYNMTTNATLLDDEIISYIKKYNFGLMISMDGPQEIQDKMRPMLNGKGSFETASANIKKLLNRRKRVSVRCTVSNQCLETVKIVDFLERFGYSRVALSRCNGNSYGLGKYDVGPEENQILDEQNVILTNRFFEQLKDGTEPVYNPFNNGLRDIHNPPFRKLRCGVARGCTTVGIDGSLYPCHRYVGMEQYNIGNVYDGVDNSKHEKYLRSYFETKRKCESCWAINICGGCCPWYVSHPSGQCIPPKDWWCDGIKTWFERCAWAYTKIKNEHQWYYNKLFGPKKKDREVGQKVSLTA